VTTLASRPAAPPAGVDPRPAGPDGRHWLRTLAPYREPRPARGLAELAATAAPFAALWLAALLSLGHGYWLTLLLAVPAAGFLVRLFMIQHDCGHGSFLGRRRADDWLGRAIGVVTLTPYGCWRRAHAVHHATSGHLDRRGVGDIGTLTVREYRRLPPWRRALYRLSRHPVVLLVVGPPLLFVLKHRVPPAGLARSGAAWRSAMSTNLAIAATVGLAAALAGPRAFALVHAPIMWLASSAGVWLFYVQHQYEHAYWEREDGWDVHAGALRGSSHLELPGVLRWLTANIGVHHVHHLCSRIPSYRLGEVLRDHPELRGVNRLTLGASLRCLHLALWDEDGKRMVGFREARAAAAS